ncbi:hypothetical protein ACQP00_19470 [Dactylosporangium sp. CS-047395]|uniref:hypothetical protein n=1 Tax=Dactylosporangium sp. CS-047395 TaxID=3239936 RepID=UPI003D9494F9
MDASIVVEPNPPGLASGLDAAKSSDGAGRAGSHDEEEPLYRRTVLYGIVGALGVARDALPEDDCMEAVRRNVDRGLRAPVTPSDVEEWERTAWQYAREVGAVPPATVLPELLVDLDEAHARLTEADDKLRNRLARVCAELSALTAIALIASDSPGPARRFWRTAVRAADQTTDHALQARIRGRRAVFALYDDLPVSTALSMAEDAVTVSDGHATAGAASGYAARAQGFAQLGQHNEARRALGDLEATFKRLGAATVDDRRSQWGWSQQRLLHVASFVYAHAGDASRASQAQESALALYPRCSIKDAHKSNSIEQCAWSWPAIQSKARATPPGRLPACPPHCDTTP